MEEAIEIIYWILNNLLSNKSVEWPWDESYSFSREIDTRRVLISKQSDFSPIETYLIIPHIRLRYVHTTHSRSSTYERLLSKSLFIGFAQVLTSAYTGQPAYT